MELNIKDLLDLLFRWVHLIAGIMWIGNSMLFNWLDRNLVKPSDARDGFDGEIWMVHSGGFYQVEKMLLEPSQMPPVLHWFKWQAYTTWITGFCLLVLVYYLNTGYLTDVSVMQLSHTSAVGISLGLLAGTLVVYDLFWRSPLGKVKLVPHLISIAYVVAVAFALSKIFGGRAAYFHVGAMLGTLMAGNVFFRIMPAQRELIAATTSGRKQDYAVSMRAKQRSIHNNYMTFPVLFIMISNHFPVLYGHKLSWVILILLIVGGAGVRHCMNIRFHYKAWLPTLFAVAIGSLGGVVAILAFSGKTATASSNEAVSYAQVKQVIQERCVRCHSAKTTDTEFTTAPGGVMFDTPEQTKQWAERIKARAVITTTMPLANRTQMKPEERELLGRWIAQGAKID